jgi:ribosomal protein S27AE
MVSQCPGAVNIRMPRLEVRQCPKCGDEIEIVSNESSAKCSKCGFVIYNDLLSCVEWCEYARECVGDKAYERVMKELSERQNSAAAQ